MNEIIVLRIFGMIPPVFELDRVFTCEGLFSVKMISRDWSLKVNSE